MTVHLGKSGALQDGKTRTWPAENPPARIQDSCGVAAAVTPLGSAFGLAGKAALLKRPHGRCYIQYAEAHAKRKDPTQGGSDNK
jgi:hypothetical protein